MRAEVIGQSVGSDASRLSCFLFRPRKSREKRRKRSHTNVSNASVIRTSRVSQTPLQTPIPYFHQWVPHDKKALVAIACKTAHVRFHRRKRVHTPGFQRRIAHSGSHAETEAFRTGPLSLPSERSARLQTSPGRVSERRTLPLLGLGWVYFRRTQKACGTAMRLCVSLFRGVAAPLGCVIFLQFGDVAVFSLCAVLSERARLGWYHYPRCALHVLEMPDGRLSKRLTCRFLRSGGRSSPHDFYFLANMQVSLSENSVATTFALWYNKSKELEEFQNNYAV